MTAETLSYHFETYGCQMNTAESAALKLALDGRGWTEESPETALLLILNTCSVRETAEQRVLGRLAHYAALKKKRPPLFVLVCGCMASRLGGKLVSLGADFVMGATESERFTAILAEVERLCGFSPPRHAGPHGGTPDIPPPSADNPLAGREAVKALAGPSPPPPSPSRALVPIMSGCDNFCSYCIVPYVRGPERCRGVADILAEIGRRAAGGAREITLLGQNVNSYSKDGSGFPELLEAVAGAVAGTPIRRLRFLSSHPKDLSERTIEVMAANPVFCRHIHLCVQHGSNRILSAMNRRYTRERFLRLAADLRRAMPGITLSTDILVGFPGETEEDFAQVLSLMDEVRFLYAFMYHYNPREGTAAFGLPDRVAADVKGERLRRVIERQRGHTEAHLRARIGRTEEVLVEGVSRRNSAELLCSTEHGEMAAAPGSRSLIGSFARMTLEGLSGSTLRGRFCQ